MNLSIDCIIPFYNEEMNISSVLQVVTNIKNINQIFCVDDGSTDRSASIVQKNFPEAKLIRLKENLGKTDAIEKGLQHVRTDYVLLLDADLIDLKSYEIEKAIAKIEGSPEIDMIILKRIREKFLVRLIRMDTVLSGQRILRLSDLKKVLDKRITNYDLEVAINEYMMNNRKKVYWMPTSAVNTERTEKWGIKHSVKTNFEMFFGFLKYPGISSLTRQLCFFAKRRAK